MLNTNLNWSHEDEVLAEDGLQSKIERDWTLVPWDAMALVVQVLETGKAKYGKDNWKRLPDTDHVEHMIEHAIATYQCLDDDALAMEHLTHTICRALFALQLIYEECLVQHDD